MSKIKKFTSISNDVWREVMKRDNAKCIVCGEKHNLQIAHYISRARLGLGISENLVVLCLKCHYEYDNGKKHKEYKEFIKNYLKSKYPDWDEKKIVFKKWRF